MRAAIMCASSWIKGKPTINKIITENESNGVIVVATRRFDTNPKPVKLFILGSGKISDYKDIDRFIIDTGNGLGRTGYLKVENIFEINDKEVTNSINDIGKDEKRVFYVFK